MAHKVIPMGPVETKSNDVRNFGRAVDTLNVDINRVNEPQRRLGMVRRLAEQQSGVIRLMFSYSGLCSRYFDLAGGGGMIFTHGEFYGGILTPGRQPGISILPTLPETPTVGILPLSEFVALGGGSIHLEWRYPDGSKQAPFGAVAVVIMRKAGAEPESIDDEDATEVYRDLGYSYIDEEVDDAQSFFYKAWVLYQGRQSAPKSASVLTDVIFVDKSAAAGGNGKSWDTAFQHPQDALDVFEDGDQIWASKGTYTRKSAADRRVIDSESLSLADMTNVIMYGGMESGDLILTGRDYTSNPTILDGENFCYNVFRFDGESLVFDGFTVRRGRGAATGSFWDRYGAGVEVVHRDLTSGAIVSSVMTDCRFEDCRAQGNGNGGGVYAFQGSFSFESCVFDSCHAGGTSGSGGGLAVDNYYYAPMVGDVDVVDCLFTSCRSDKNSGGGFYVSGRNWNTALSVSGCSFSSCFALDNGGGMVVEDESCSSMSVNADFTGNSSGSRGGGLFVEVGGTIASCVFSGNTSLFNGGGMHASSDLGLLAVTGCEFSSNTATLGGGVFTSGMAGSMLISSCGFTNNAQWALYSDDPSKVSLSELTFSGNVPGDVGP